MGPHWNYLIEAVSLSTHNIFFLLRNKKNINAIGWKDQILPTVISKGKFGNARSSFLPFYPVLHEIAGLGGSVRCALDWWWGGCGFDPHLVRNILSWRLIMRYFLRTFSPFHWFKKGSWLYLAKECPQILVNHLEDKACPGKVWLGKMTLMDWLGRKTSTQSIVMR